MHNARKSSFLTYDQPFCENKRTSCSLAYRGSNLSNLMRVNNLALEKIGFMSNNEEISFVHKFKDTFKVGCSDLVHQIFQ